MVQQTGVALRLSESNASTTHPAHVFQIWLNTPAPGLEAGDAHRRFTKSERNGTFCLVASPDGRHGSLRVHQDVFLYSAILAPGRHVVHELFSGRSAWLHVVHGNVRLGDDALGVGDGAGFTHEGSVSITATTECEVLLLDLVVEGDGDETPYDDAGPGIARIPVDLPR